MRLRSSEKVKYQESMCASALVQFRKERPFRLLAVDTVPHPRPFTDCLQDRGYIYQPNLTPGGKPVAVGHSTGATALRPSLLAFLPDGGARHLPRGWSSWMPAGWRRTRTLLRWPRSRSPSGWRSRIGTPPDWGYGNEERWWRLALWNVPIPQGQPVGSNPEENLWGGERECA